MPNRNDAIYDLLMNAKHAEPESGVITAEVAILVYKAASLCRNPTVKKLISDIDATIDATVKAEIEELGIPEGSPQCDQIRNQLKVGRKAELSIQSTEKISTALWAYLDKSLATKKLGF